QPKLVRVLVQRKFRRIGAARIQPTPARVFATATATTGFGPLLRDHFPYPITIPRLDEHVPRILQRLWRSTPRPTAAVRSPDTSPACQTDVTASRDIPPPTPATAGGASAVRSPDTPSGPLRGDDVGDDALARLVGLGVSGVRDLVRLAEAFAAAPET